MNYSRKINSIIFAFALFIVDSPCYADSTDEIPSYFTLGFNTLILANPGIYHRVRPNASSVFTNFDGPLFLSGSVRVYKNYFLGAQASIFGMGLIAMDRISTGDDDRLVSDEIFLETIYPVFLPREFKSNLFSPRINGGWAIRYGHNDKYYESRYAAGITKTYRGKSIGASTFLDFRIIPGYGIRLTTIYKKSLNLREDDGVNNITIEGLGIYLGSYIYI